MSLILDGSSGTTGNLANGDLQVNGVTVGKGGGTIATNTAIGTNTIRSNTVGSNNTAIGVSALYDNITGSGNVALGCAAGAQEMGSNKLYIANSTGTSADALIYGEFDNTGGLTGLVRINGRLELNTPYVPTSASDPGSVGQITIAATDIALSSAYNGMRIQITAGTGVGQVADILEVYLEEVKVEKLA